MAVAVVIEQLESSTNHVTAFLTYMPFLRLHMNTHLKWGMSGGWGIFKSLELGHTSATCVGHTSHTLIESQNLNSYHPHPKSPVFPHTMYGLLHWQYNPFTRLEYLLRISLNTPQISEPQRSLKAINKLTQYNSSSTVPKTFSWLENDMLRSSDSMRIQRTRPYQPLNQNSPWKLILLQGIITYNSWNRTYLLQKTHPSITQ